MNRNNQNQIQLKAKKTKIEPKRHVNECGVLNSMRVYGNGHQPKQKTTQPAFKFVDTFNSNINIMASGTILPGTVQVSQGAGVSQRVGNRIYIERAFFNYNITQLNSDTVTQSRIIIFQWMPSSSIVPPVVLDILETVNDVQSMYNWEFSNQYRIIYDQVFFQSGTSTNPTATSNVGHYGEIDITRAIKALEFTGVSALGSHQLYILVISDSLIAPFPQFDSTFRLVYRD
jgi:hypothetical protein